MRLVGISFSILSFISESLSSIRKSAHTIIHNANPTTTDSRALPNSSYNINPTENAYRTANIYLAAISAIVRQLYSNRKTKSRIIETRTRITTLYTTDEDGNWIEVTLIEALDAEAERIEIAPTDSSEGVSFSPVLNHPELVAWADQEVTAYNAADLLRVLRTFQPNPKYDERENYEAVCVEIQELETFETGSNLYDSEREAYVLYAEQE